MTVPGNHENYFNFTHYVSRYRKVFWKQKISELNIEVSNIPFIRKLLIVLSLTRTPSTIAMIMVWSMCFILLPKYISIHNGFRRSISKDSMNSSKQIWKKPVRIKIKVNHLIIYRIFYWPALVYSYILVPWIITTGHRPMYCQKKKVDHCTVPGSD